MIYLFTAEDEINAILRDCEPVAISVLVCNDRLTKHRRNFTESDISKVHGAGHGFKPSKEPQFDAVKSQDTLKEALEFYGVLVIPVINRSSEYLAAILSNLASRKIPGCELLWFIFSGHGAGSHFLVNDELVPFDELIRKSSAIPIKRMAFFFDCCQVNTNGIKAVDIQKEHMAVYSAPPNEVAYYLDGVGLMVTCLAELLLWFKGSLNELQCKLREKLLSKMGEVLHIPSGSLEKWRQSHLPHHTSSMFDINLCNKINEASKCTVGSDLNRPVGRVAPETHVGITKTT